MIGTIAGKTEEMDQLMRSFSALVEDSLANAEAKANQAGSLLADNANTTARAIAEQFDLIRTTTGKERERTSTSMRAAHEQAVGEIGELFGSAAERFNDGDAGNAGHGAPDP